MNIVIPDKIDLTPDYRTQLENLPNIKIYDDLVTDEDIILERIKDAEIVTANFYDLTADIINKSPKLKYIIVPAVGYDWIDKQSAIERNIKIINCPTFNSQAVAEHAIALLFSIARRIVESDKDVIKGEWNTQKFIGVEVQNKNMLVVGNGNIGKRIQNLSNALGMNVDYIDSKTSTEDFDSKLKLADFVILSIPLNDKTKNIIDARRLSLLKKSAILINVGRGLLVEQDALYKSLNEKLILGAGIDVFPNDATLKKPTEEISRFFLLDNVVGTPHIGFHTHETSARLGKELIENIKACLDGNPINVVV